MSDFKGLQGFALARESAFFKLEQEADIQRHRQRLVTQGRIEDIAGGYLMPRRQLTPEESITASMVLAEVLQQQTRLDNPYAADRKKFVRRMRAQLPKLTEAEMNRYRSTLYGMASLAIPGGSLSRSRVSTPKGYQSAMPPLKVSAQAREVADRAFNTGARSLVYGSCIGAATVLLVVAVAARTMDVTSVDELQLKAKQNGPKVSEAFREWMLPLGTWIKGLGGSKTNSRPVSSLSQSDGVANQKLASS